MSGGASGYPHRRSSNGTSPSQRSQQYGASQLAPGYLGSGWSNLLTTTGQPSVMNGQPGAPSHGPSYSSHEEGSSRQSSFPPPPQLSSAQDCSSHAYPQTQPTTVLPAHFYNQPPPQSARAYQLPETRAAAQFAQYQAQRPGRFTNSMSTSSPSNSHGGQDSSPISGGPSLPPITAIPEYHHGPPTGSAYFSSTTTYSPPIQGSPVSGSPSMSNASHPPHAPDNRGQTTSSSYPPTGPATFPSPNVQESISVDSPPLAHTSAGGHLTHGAQQRPQLRSPTSETRTSLQPDSIDNSISQLRMFAQRFQQNAHPSHLAPGQSVPQSQGTIDSSNLSLVRTGAGPGNRPCSTAAAAASKSSRASDKAPEAAPTAASTAAQPPRWSRQLLPASAPPTPPNAQYATTQPPQQQPTPTATPQSSTAAKPSPTARTSGIKQKAPASKSRDVPPPAVRALASAPSSGDIDPAKLAMQVPAVGSNPKPSAAPISPPTTQPITTSVAPSKATVSVPASELHCVSAWAQLSQSAQPTVGPTTQPSNWTAPAAPAQPPASAAPAKPTVILPPPQTTATPTLSQTSSTPSQSPPAGPSTLSIATTPEAGPSQPKRGPGRPRGSTREAAVRAAMLSEGIDPDLHPKTLAAALQAAAKAAAHRKYNKRETKIRDAIAAAGLDPDNVNPEVRAEFEPKRGRPRKDRSTAAPDSPSSNPPASPVVATAPPPNGMPANAVLVTVAAHATVAVASASTSTPTPVKEPAPFAVQARPSSMAQVRPPSMAQSRSPPSGRTPPHIMAPAQPVHPTQSARSINAQPSASSTSPSAPHLQAVASQSGTSIRDRPSGVKPNQPVQAHPYVPATQPLNVRPSADTPSRSQPAPHIAAASASSFQASAVAPGAAMHVQPAKAAPVQAANGAPATNGTPSHPSQPSSNPRTEQAPPPVNQTQPNMMLPFNRAIVVIPISSTRREQLIARGMYIPFRDDADPEHQSVSRQSARQVAKIAVPRVSKLATQQRVREPEPIRNRFTHHPQMLEIFASILTEESLLNRLGIDGCFKCEWKGCGAEMASEALLQRHIKARNHAAQGAFDLRGLTIYECHWRGCERPAFKTAAKLVQHLVAKHVSERLVCPYGECSWRSSSISHLYRHVSRTHDGEEPRFRVDEMHAPELSQLEALPSHVNTDVLTTPRATGTSCRTQRHQEHAHDKVIRMCIAPENPDITISHPPHMLVVLDEEESLVTTREPSEGTDGVVGDDGNQDTEGETDESMDVDDEGSPELDHMILFKDIVIDNDDSSADYNNNSFGDDATPIPEAFVGTLAVKASSQSTRCKRKRTSASSMPRAAKRVMARRAGTRQSTVSNGNAEIGTPSLSTLSGRALGGTVEPGTWQYIDSIQVPKIDTSTYTRLYLE